MMVNAKGYAEYVYPVREVVKVTDGDTYWLRVDTGFRNLLLVNIRLQGFDTPEKTKGSAFEKAEAKRAQEVAENFLWMGRTSLKWWVQTEKDPDNFGRWLGDIWIEREDGSELHLGDWMREHLLASVWPTRWRDEFDQHGALREEDMEFTYYHAEDQPVNQGPRGVMLRYKPTGQIFQSSTRRSQLENKEVVLGLLKETL